MIVMLMKLIKISEKIRISDEKDIEYLNHRIFQGNPSSSDCLMRKPLQVNLQQQSLRRP